MGVVGDLLGDKLKEFERVNSDRRAGVGIPVVVRVDGVSFSKFTRKALKPFDHRISEAMLIAASSVVAEFNCRIAYTQSDEISFLLYDPESELPHGGRFEKLASRFASSVTASFLRSGLQLFPELIGDKLPTFDGRVMALPSLDIAAKVFHWREIDARRNAVSMAARTVCSHAELQGRSVREQIEMMSIRGLDFVSFPDVFRRGSFLRRMSILKELTPDELSRILRSIVLLARSEECR